MKKRTLVRVLAIVLVGIAVLVGYRIYLHQRIQSEIAKLKSGDGQAMYTRDGHKLREGEAPAELRER